MTKIILLLLVLGIVAGTGAWYLHRGDTVATSFRTVALKRGDLVATIGATGTVEPEEVVDVGAQVAGQIISFDKDVNGKTIDYGSVVDVDTVLAKIDDSLYAADQRQSQAQLEQAKAGVEVSQANLLQMKAKLVQAQRDWERAQKLGPSDALAETTYDAYEATYATAKANVAVAEAAITQAKASVTQAEANLFRAQRNLGYCTIKSPVKGVIIDRRVNIGQTVVSSLNAPSLFLIAKDLKRMQVWVAVNEADIGNITQGQSVTFAVDAFAGRTFKGTVEQVRLNATMTQNVVTYTVVITTDNSDGKLYPYMSANVKFEVSRRDGVLTVPNEALRWFPQVEQVVPDAREAATTAAASSGGGRRSGGAAAETPTTRPAGGQKRDRSGTLWVVEGKLVRPVKVRLGLSDGVSTEVQNDQLEEGTEVVVGETQAQQASDDVTNPFAPRMPQRRQPQQQPSQQPSQRPPQ